MGHAVHAVPLVDKVYTALFGGYDELRPALDSRVGHVLFTDGERSGNVNGWEIVNVKRRFVNPARENRYYKLQPHLHFPLKTVMYHDASMKLRLPATVIAKQMVAKDPHADAYFLRHSLGHHIQDEFDWLREKGIVDNDLLDYLRVRYSGIENDIPGVEARLFLAKPSAEPLFRLWWDEVREFAHRDQISYYYALKESGVRVCLLDFRETRAWYHIFPHSKPQLSGAR